MMNSPIDLYALILAGGKSSRMGYDKRTMKVHPVNQQEYLFSLLKSFCEKVFVSCKEVDTLSADYNPLADQYELDSPLNGILSAFKLHPERSWLIVAIDMPCIDHNTLEHLIAHRDKQCKATVYKDSSGNLPDPMLGIWESHCAQELLAFFQDGNKSPREFLSSHKIHLLSVPDPEALTNVNTPDELKRLNKDHGE